MKKILLITSPFRPNIGGVETHLDDLISAANEKDFVFDVVTYQPLVTRARGKFIERFSGNVIFRIPWPRFNLFLRLEKLPALEFLYLFPGLFLGSLIYLTFCSRNIKAIHAQGLAAGVTGLILGKLFRKKSILSTHSIYNFPPNGIYRMFAQILFNNVDMVFTLSKQSKKEVEGLQIGKNKVFVFTYWVDETIFKPMSKIESRNTFSLRSSDFVALFVGRLVDVKGVKQFLDAGSKDSENIYLIAGSGPLENIVNTTVQKHKNLLFLGPVENQKLPKVYSASDVLIVPSQNDEGFGRVILESLSCGTPVIGAKKGAIPEALNSKAGFLIEPNTSEIIKYVNYLKYNKILLNKLRENAVLFAKEKYSKQNVDLIIKHY